MTTLLLDLIRWATVVVQFLEFEAAAHPERCTAHLAEQGRSLIGRLKGEVKTIVHEDSDPSSLSHAIHPVFPTVGAGAVDIQVPDRTLTTTDGER